MKSRHILWVTCAATALALAFEAGVVVGESTPPDSMRGVNISAPTVLDLAQQLEGIERRQLRSRVITFEPGRAVPLHSHKGRPGIAYVLKGTLTEHVEGQGGI